MSFGIVFRAGCCMVCLFGSCFLGTKEAENHLGDASEAWVKPANSTNKDRDEKRTTTRWMDAMSFSPCKTIKDIYIYYIDLYSEFSPNRKVLN